MKTSKKQIDNYVKIANYLNMRSFDKCPIYLNESMTKLDKKLKRLHLSFEDALMQANAKIKQDLKDKKELERKDKIATAKYNRNIKIAAEFLVKVGHGLASTKEYAKPHHFLKSDFLEGSYKSNTGAGNFWVSVKLGETFNATTYVSKNWDVYAKSCSFAANDYDTVITLPKHGQFQLIGGLWTYTANYNRKGCKASWVEQIGLQVHRVSGFLVNGYHVFDDNIKTVKQARAYVLALRLRQRAKQMKLTKKTYTLEDSLHCGNCRPGSLAFANAHNIDPNGTYTGAFLLSIATPNEMYFVKRFVK